MNFNEQIAYSWRVSSWEESSHLLFKLQKRLFKTAYVFDRKKSLILQKLILQSNCSRLLAIREVTQLNVNRKIPGVDGKAYLTFLEKFELSENLKINWNKWEIQSLKKVLLIKDKDTPTSMKIPTMSDRAWLSLVKYALEPVHEVFFHPSNYGFRPGQSVYEVQKAFLLSLSKDSFGTQKRILKIDMKNALSSFDRSYLVKKIQTLRSIKLGLFRLLEKGFELRFPEDNFIGSTFDSLISNILLDGIEVVCNDCIHYGYQLLFFLKPYDNEKFVVRKLNNFITNAGMDLKGLYIDIIATSKGFNFLGWYFTPSYDNLNGFYCFPSFDNYQNFVRRVKRIINNSNYGSSVKASKLYPIVKEWRSYHKYSNLIGSKYSLFFIKKRTFKAFNSESKQDFYSSKRLIDKCFSVLKLVDEEMQDYKISRSPFNGHITFWIDLSYSSNSIKPFINYRVSNYFCVHCGMKNT